MSPVKRRLVEAYLPNDLQVTAEFLVDGKQVRELKVVLHTQPGGPGQWLVRIETHGGRPHKHVAWDDGGELRHKQLKGWPDDYSKVVTRAIQDIKANWQTYEGLYRAWIASK